jgi:hypothetical protein
MKTSTIQEQYNLLKEGKGHKGVFMKTVRNLFPEYVNQYTSFDDAVNILKSKSILNEGIGGLVTTGKKQDWHAIFNENVSALKEEKEAKAEEKKPTKEITDMETRGFDYKDPKNIDNVYGQEFLLGYYTEMKDPKNEKKTVDELKAIVAKNLAKDNQHYVKDGQFGVKGLGYSVDHPGLGETKEVKGKYKSSGMEPVKLKESVEYDLEEMIQFRPQKGGGGRRFIPSFHTLPKDAVVKYPGLIKMINSPVGVEMYISTKLPPVFTAITRGRQNIDSLPPLLKKLQDHIPREVINLIKNNIDNKTITVNGEPMHKVNLPISRTDDGDYKIATPFAAGLTENKNMELESAKDEAKMSSEEGYVQHVNKTENGYEVSDWYDSDTTVVSYENGEEINNREDMFIDGDMYDQNYQYDDENPDLRDLGANPKLYEEMTSGINYDATIAAELKSKFVNLSKLTPYVLDFGNKVTQDNTGKVTIHGENNKRKIFKDVDDFLTGIGYKAMKMEETKLRNVISQLIKEELNIKEIEETGEDAKKKAMTKKIDEEMAKRKKKLKALTTLTELEKDSVNPKKMKELQAEIKKLEVLREKLNKGKKKEMIDEDTPLDIADKKTADAEVKLAAAKKEQAKVLEKPGTQS